tara:strand:- start:3216 stop:3509 length:294 start_codon:yes stop_codon:yes gene_type:complete
MNLNKESLTNYKLHAITLLTGASVGMSQISNLDQYSPIAAGLAFLLSASSYSQIINRVDDLIENLEDAGIIDEETANKLEEVADSIEGVVESINKEE